MACFFVVIGRSKAHTVFQGQSNGPHIIHTNGYIYLLSAGLTDQPFQEPISKAKLSLFGPHIGIASFQISVQVQAGLLLDLFCVFFQWPFVNHGPDHPSLLNGVAYQKGIAQVFFDP